MSSATTTKRKGRPSIADASVTIRVNQVELAVADSIAEDLEALVHMKQSRADVLRSALSHGLQSIRTEVNAKMKISKR